MAVDKNGDRFFSISLDVYQLDTLYIKYIMNVLKTSKPDSELKNVDTVNVYKQPKYFPQIWKFVKIVPTEVLINTLK